MWNTKSVRGIKRRAFVYGFLTTLSLFVLSYFGTFRSAINVIRDNLDESIGLLSQQSAELLSVQLDNNLTSLSIASQLPEITQQPFSAAIASLPHLRTILGFSELALATSDGLAHYPDGLVLDLSDRNYIQSALQGLPTISDPLISRVSGQWVIIAAAPYFSQAGELTGVIMGRIDAGVLNELVTNAGFGQSGYAYLIHQDGQILAHPNPSFVQTPPFTVDQLANQFPPYQDFLRFFREALGSNQGVGSYSLHGQTLRFGHAQVPQTKWILFVGASEEELLRGLFTLQHIILIVASGFTLLLGLGIYRFLGSFLQPALDLEQLFLKAAQGSFHVRASGSYPDEFSRLAQSFNSLLEQIQSLTYYDALTNLPNFRSGLEQIGKFLALGHQEKVVVLIITIDRFSSIQQGTGYIGADWLLVQLANRLQSKQIESQLLFRGPGEHFVLVFTCKNKDEFLQLHYQPFIKHLSRPYELVDSKIIHRLKSPQAGTKTFHVTYSSGFSIFPDHGTIPEELVDHANLSMAMVQEQGGKGIQEFSLTLLEERSIKNQIEIDLPQGLTNNQFFLVYQPIRELKTGKLFGLEALIRWNHPDLGFISPEQFISVAERSGFIHRISSWVFTTVCIQIRTWKDQGLVVPAVSINLSSQEFEYPGLVQTLLETLHHYDLQASAIKIEITERTVIQQIDQGKEKIINLQKQGIEVALDDFGIGYSSLNYLVSLPVSTIKIDKSFIMEIHNNPQSRAIVLGLLGMAKNLGIRVVCEGIETSEQFQWLLHQAADLGQGYFISRPKEPHDQDLISMFEESI
jgi:diguanylate cyclase (GGDEF)-like protein